MDDKGVEDRVRDVEIGPVVRALTVECTGSDVEQRGPTPPTHGANYRRPKHRALLRRAVYIRNVMAPFLSSDWFDTSARLVGRVELPPGSQCRVQFDASGTRFFLLIEKGRVSRFELGDVDRPDVELHFSCADAERLFRHELQDDDAMRAVTVAAQLDDGRYVGPPAPADLLARPEICEMPTIADSSLTVEYTFGGGPFGVVHHWIRFDDGKPTKDGFGVLEAADVRIGVNFWAIPRVRSGEQTILDALEGGSIVGELGPLAMLAGLLEAPEFHAAELATGRHSFALAVLGELWANETWINALHELAAQTESA